MKVKKEENIKKIINIVKKNGKIRSKDLFEKAMKHMSNATIHYRLKELVENGTLKRIVHTHTNVEYEFTEFAELELLLIEIQRIGADSFRNLYKQMEDDADFRKNMIKSLKRLIQQRNDILKQKATLNT